MLSIPEVSLYSLQVGKWTSEIDEFKHENRLYDLSPQIKDFADTAVLISQLDLVISVDTAVIHLAGAMGKPVWTLLGFDADWRWMQDREDTPWYPTMRLFRQRQHGDWESVFAQVIPALKQHLARDRV
ncbi:ADP-heptose:LPS heptosyltransferase [Pleurocapsa sp. PCC 7327]|uniref:glycosyltransferase family 9 protein n=1 Tax=Pleurocapsa sp. PCC 7327 TaxID=118163 RepID=UPI00029FE22B|nr:glycosyltransferase family 9 protein [Pleurocapsa sp. PCC 7327]AFY78154.1 ADP-heptose:LPS heptosyltransferase [Pleurocapsa sp. PCC 7327]